MIPRNCFQRLKWFRLAGAWWKVALWWIYRSFKALSKSFHEPLPIPATHSGLNPSEPPYSFGKRRANPKEPARRVVVVSYAVLPRPCSYFAPTGKSAWKTQLLPRENPNSPLLTCGIWGFKQEKLGDTHGIASTSMSSRPWRCFRPRHHGFQTDHVGLE